MNTFGTRLVAACVGVLLSGCSPAGNRDAAIGGGQCDPDLVLPAGFCAEVFHPGIGRAARHLAVLDNGDVIVARRGKEGGLFALRDSDGDGQADQQEQWSDRSGTGVVVHRNHVFYSTPQAIMRFTPDPDSLLPAGPPEIVIDGYSDNPMHASKAMAFDGKGGLYVNIGAPSNACQEPSRTAGVPGLDPCPLLNTSGGVWRYDANTLGQKGLEDGVRYATGIRMGLAMAWNSSTDSLYLVQHGRDQLSELWPDLYTPAQRAELPAEQFFKVSQNSDFGWPYCYYDHLQQRKVLNPEYGGDGQKVGRCAGFDQPIAAYPGHWAPNDLVFYERGSYPERYAGGAFVAFHGSWNRAPFPQEGYRVVFQPFEPTGATAHYETFIDGFAQSDSLDSPGLAKYRPTGLAIDPLGQLWVSDSRMGRIWRIRYSSPE